MRSIVSETNRKGTVSANDTITHGHYVTKEVISAHTIVETYMQTRKNSTETATKKRFEMIHTPEKSDIEVVINTCDIHV